MNDQNRVPDTSNSSNKPPGDQGLDEDAVPIPSRLRAATDDVKEHTGTDRDERDIVAEYEARYYGGRDRLEAARIIDADEPPRRRQRARTEPKPKRKFDHAPDNNERKWAAVAHGSTLLTALSAFTGVGVLVTMFIPLLIYFSFRKRSEYVAFHALQAFALQLVGTVGWLALVLFGSAIAFALLIVSIILIVVAVGVVLVPLVALIWVLFLVASLALPVGMVIYSMIAAVETWSGHNYRIPFVARWVEGQMYSSKTTTF